MAHIRLHVQQADGGLPMICMRCGEPATVIKTKKLSYYPRWLFLLILVGAPGLLVMLILALVLRQRARLQAPFCERHQNHWTIRTVIGWAAGIGIIGTAAAAVTAMIMLENAGARQADNLGPFICIGSLVLFVVLLIVLAILQNTAIRPDEITRTHVLLNGVSDAFVTGVEEAEIERRVRLRQWQYEDEAERAPPGRPGDEDLGRPRLPASSDAIEAERPRPAMPADAFEAEKLRDTEPPA